LQEQRHASADRNATVSHCALAQGAELRHLGGKLISIAEGTPEAWCSPQGMRGLVRHCLYVPDHGDGVCDALARNVRRRAMNRLSQHKAVRHVCTVT
jgi:hypothetical protein